MFLTIPRAQQAVREAIVNGMIGDVIVYLHGGDYELNETLRFDDRDSGKDGFRIEYRNVPGEEPVLLGGKKITYWERHDSSIWKARVSAGISSNRKGNWVVDVDIQGSYGLETRNGRCGYLVTRRGKGLNRLFSR